MPSRSYFHDIVSVLGSNITVTASNITIGIILTRILGASGFGIYTSTLVVPMIVISLTQLGIRRSTIYHISSGKIPEDSIVSAMVILLILTSFLTILISSLVFLFSESRTADTRLILLVLATVPLVLCNIFAGGVFLGKHDILKANIINAGPTLMNLVFIVLFVCILKMSAFGAFLALFAGNVVMFFYVFFTIWKSYKITWKYHEWIIKSMVKLGVVFAISVFMMQLNYRVDIILLKRLSTLEQIGLYSLATQIAEQLWHIPSAIETIVLTRSAASSEDRLVHKTVASIARVSFIFAVTGGFIIYFISPFLVPLIFGKSFTGSVRLIQMILPGVMVLILFRILNSRLAGMGKPQVAIYTFIPALIINIVLNYIWIPRFGAMGAVWATNVSYSVGTISFLIIYLRITEMSLKELVTFRKSDFYFIRNIKKNIKQWKASE
ncbi:MAG: polysaccharide biosynthesis C-terminal domain-containing protein [Bacteroidota bacterium]|nr:polysaccharide biosynthesis C-terminal domain-containing protein [Bacteroidota bacterium]